MNQIGKFLASRDYGWYRYSPQLGGAHREIVGPYDSKKLALVGWQLLPYTAKFHVIRPEGSKPTPNTGLEVETD